MGQRPLQNIHTSRGDPGSTEVEDPEGVDVGQHVAQAGVGDICSAQNQLRQALGRVDAPAGRKAHHLLNLVSVVGCFSRNFETLM